MSDLKLIALGGSGKVTQNMYLYIYENEILIVDCGIGFPDLMMPGVDILIPDVSYLKKLLEEGKEIVGMILTHGHDDHIGATPYILPGLPDFPIFASPLTAAFAKNRVSESDAADREITVIKDYQEFQIGSHFNIESFPVTHSVPDTKHFSIQTPVGLFYHGTDFKIDPAPVDGVKTDLEHIAKVGKKGVRCMLMDCLRVEKKEWVPSESTTGPAMEAEMLSTKGKFVLTLMSSHIHRIQQAVDAAVKLDRKIAFVGRSVEQNVKAALDLKMLHIPKSSLVDKRDIDQIADNKLCIIIAGSQGQEGSSLVRAIYGEHRSIQIKKADKVVFSADAIPGNEIPYFTSIDELCRNRVDVDYPVINHNLHQSGHGSAPEQQELLSTVKPEYVLPIGGNDRHRIKFIDFVAKPEGYKENQVIIPENGQVLAFGETGPARIAETVAITPVTVDGLGIGDVGNIVLSDRRTLGTAGIIVLMIPRKKGQVSMKEIQVVSRGFVFMKEADEVVEYIKKTAAEIMVDLGSKAKENEVKRALERRLGRRLHKMIRREPMILPVMIDV